MTIVCWDGHTLAADKQATNHDCGNNKVTKVFKHNGHLIGIAGAGDLAIEMLEWFKAGCVKDDFPQSGDDEYGTLMVITPDKKVKMYTGRPTAVVYEQEFIAIGSGRDYALAAMHLGFGAKKAVAVACHFDVNCGNGIDTVTLDS
jgi:ATP-dependent protease HslVU (ClpYQ) peptidase subunit